MKAVAAMMVTAMFACAVAVAACFLSLVLKRKKKILLIMSGDTALAASK